MGDLGANRGEQGKGSASPSLPRQPDRGAPWIKRSKNLIADNPAIWTCDTCWDSNFPDRNVRKAVPPSSSPKTVWDMTVTIDLSSGAFNISTQVRDLESHASGTQPILAAAPNMPAGGVSISAFSVLLPLGILSAALLIVSIIIGVRIMYLSDEARSLPARSPGRGKLEVKALELDTLQRVDSRRSSPTRSPGAANSDQSNLDCFFRPFPSTNTLDDEVGAQGKAFSPRPCSPFPESQNVVCHCLRMSVRTPYLSCFCFCALF